MYPLVSCVRRIPERHFLAVPRLSWRMFRCSRFISTHLTTDVSVCHARCLMNSLASAYPVPRPTRPSGCCWSGARRRTAARLQLISRRRGETHRALRADDEYLPVPGGVPGDRKRVSSTTTSRTPRQHQPRHHCLTSGATEQQQVVAGNLSRGDCPLYIWATTATALDQQLQWRVSDLLHTGAGRGCVQCRPKVSGYLRRAETHQRILQLCYLLTTRGEPSAHTWHWSVSQSDVLVDQQLGCLWARSTVDPTRAIAYTTITVTTTTATTADPQADAVPTTTEYNSIWSASAACTIGGCCHGTSAIAWDGSSCSMWQRDGLPRDIRPVRDAASSQDFRELRRWKRKRRYQLHISGHHREQCGGCNSPNATAGYSGRLHSTGQRH